MTKADNVFRAHQIWDLKCDVISCSTCWRPDLKQKKPRNMQEGKMAAVQAWQSATKCLLMSVGWRLASHWMQKDLKPYIKCDYLIQVYVSFGGPNKDVNENWTFIVMSFHIQCEYKHKTTQKYVTVLIFMCCTCICLDSEEWMNDEALCDEWIFWKHGIQCSWNNFPFEHRD